MTKPYDLVLEYDRETKVITNRIELPWIEWNYGPMPEFKPPYGGYDEYANQFKAYIAVRKKHDIPEINPILDGKYEGDFEAIKVGDVITDEMVAASYALPMNESARMADYAKQKKEVEFYQLLGGIKPDFKLFLANAWVYKDISQLQVNNAVGKSFITEEDAKDILGIKR